MPVNPAAPSAANLTTPDRIEGDATSALYRAAIGQVNTQHYLTLFTQFESQDRAGLSWNWAAALCTLNWLAYRRLWSAALVYGAALVAAALLVFGIGRLMFQLSEMTELVIIFFGVVLSIVVPGLGGNAIFYTRSRERMAQALSASPTLEEACALLLRRSGSRLRLMVLALANAAIVGLLASGYTIFPRTGHLHPEPEKAQAAPPSATSKVSAPVTESLPAPLPTPTPAPAPAPILIPASPTPTATPAAEITPPPPVAANSVVADSSVRNPSPSPAPALAPIKADTPPAKPKPTPPAKTVPAKPRPPVTASAPIAVSAQERFYLNVGLFADDNNALNAHVKLTDAGLPSSQTEIETAKGKRTRVRVGPFDSLTDADRAAKKIRAIGLEAVLVRP